SREGAISFLTSNHGGGHARMLKRLFVPACLCLMACPATVGADAHLSELAGTSIIEKTDVPDALFSASPIASNAPIEVPPQTDIQIDVAPQADRLDTKEIQENAQAVAPVPPPDPPAKPVIYRSRQEVCDTLTKAAQSNNLPAPFFIRLLFQESRFKPGVVSRAGAQGVAQFMPDTAADMGLDNPFDPLQAIPASARLLHNLFQQFGNLGLAAAAYNAGPNRIADWLTKKSKLPQETEGYVKTITGRAADSWKTKAQNSAKFAGGGSPDMRLPRHAPCQEAAGLFAWNGPKQIPVPRASPRTLAKADIPNGHATKVAATNVVKIDIKTATTKIANAEHTRRVVQLAARTHPVRPVKDAKREPAKSSSKAARKPLELAMAQRGSHNKQ
ncbi:lytic transglycosylase domain-containing protein, partial [Actinospica sp.]|uniref:lytic transglycosylase domain-containing protein n=1 Tax=Actinospica sp. TaxID=1872142 RepID=UPI002C064CD9